MIKTLSAKLALGIGGAIIGATCIWIYWAYTTPGDYFANGSDFVIPSLWVGGILGFIASSFCSASKLKWLVILLTVSALGYWVFVPDGWWANPPPF